MDKSEGKDFFSKTFGTFTEKVAKLYHKGQKSLSLSSLKRVRNEKVYALGIKVLTLAENGEKITDDRISTEIESIRHIENQIQSAEKDYERLKKHKVKGGKKGFDVETLQKDEFSEKPVRKRRSKEEKNEENKADAKKSTVRKTRVKKAKSEEMPVEPSEKPKRGRAKKKPEKNEIKLKEKTELMVSDKQSVLNDSATNGSENEKDTL